ncbi:hypothetical protein [Defluviimonas salinarum]|uniref:Uncharacterized protein n=1 Tax=Defluviimonas salinarum TaxID=2992147 RepID=A0ABT3J5S4_9RHOB|nr:hypothetical protein [Defluviimonas salinarum]MCW3783023.1 hypothetical protein [Defluviimonas salinarum]
MSYKLHYAMHVPVEGLIDAAGVDLTPERAAAALRALADRIEADPQKARSIFRSERIVNTEVEDRWVLRSATKPKVVGKAQGGWVHADPEDIDPADTASSDYIAKHDLNPGPDALWVRPENIGGLPVLARMRGSSGKPVGQLDLRDWMAWVGEDEIEAGIRAGWDFSEAVENSTPGDPGLDPENPLVDDANLRRLDAFNFPYRTAIDAEDIPRAIAYLDELRPGFIDRIGLREDVAQDPEP